MINNMIKRNDSKAKYNSIKYKSRMAQKIDFAKLLTNIGFEDYDFFVHQSGLRRGVSETKALENVKDKLPERSVIPFVMERGLDVYPYATIKETTNLIENSGDALALASELLDYTYEGFLNRNGGNVADGVYGEAVNVVIAIPRRISLRSEAESKMYERCSSISVPFSRVVPDRNEGGVQYFPIDNVMYQNKIEQVRPEFVLGVACLGREDVSPETYINERFLAYLPQDKRDEILKFWGDKMKEYYDINVPSSVETVDASDNRFDTPSSAVEKVVAGTKHAGANGCFAPGSYLNDFDFD